jgi:crossover junction endodeoxyribonuclease RuvC
MTPREIKKAITGTGAGTKEQVQFMLTKLLRLKTAPRPADASDGVAAALGFLMGVHLEAAARRASQ